MWANVWINQDALGRIAAHPNDFVAGMLAALQTDRGEGQRTIVCGGFLPAAVVVSVGWLEAPSPGETGERHGQQARVSRRA